GESARLDAGVSLRRVRSEDFLSILPPTAFGAATVGVLLPDYANGTALRSSGFVQQTVSAWSQRLRFHAGVSFDNDSIDHDKRVRPQASVDIGLTKKLLLTAGFGEYVQYPEIGVFRSVYGSPGLPPM